MSIECIYCIYINDDGADSCASCGMPLASGPSSSGGSYYLPVGTVLQQGCYEIGDVLGAGGFGITYRGRDLKTNTAVAIKELWPEKAIRQKTMETWPISISPRDKQEQLRKFQEEAEYQKQCVHANVAEIYTCFEENGTAYIVMEFVAGKSLYSILKDEGVLSEERAKRYFLQIGKAVEVVHRKNFLHRDIKPENILVDDQDRAVLIDFGSTREFIAGQTHQMSALLTQGYAPLEQYTVSARRWPATDFYAVCASMYELLTGQLPAESVSRVQVGSDPLIPPRQHRSTISLSMEKVILTGLKMKVEDRFQNASEFILALNGQFVEPSHRKARELVSQNKLAEAVQAYKRCLRTETDNQEAAVEMALVQLYADTSNAEKGARQAIKLAPGDGRGHGALGLVYCRQANWTEACRQLKKAVLLAPREAWIQANLAWALGKVGNWKEAESVVAKALNLDPNQVFARGIQAWIAMLYRQWKSVIRYAKPAIFRSKQMGPQEVLSEERRSHQQWLYPLLTAALTEVRITSNGTDLDRCIQEFVRLNPRSALAWGLQGWRDSLNGKLNEAKTDLERAYHLTDPPAWALINLGIVYEQLGNYPLAILAYNTCQQKAIESGFLCLRLGTVYAQLKHWELAQECLEKAISLDSTLAAAYHNLAWILRNQPGEKKQSEFRQILGEYRKAIDLYMKQNNRQAAVLNAALSEVGIDLQG